MRVSETVESRKAVLESLPEWTPPHLPVIEVLPELRAIFPFGCKKVDKDVRAGWIDIRVDHQRVKVPFQFVGLWNFDMIRNIKPKRLAALVMRGLHPKLMQAKHDGKLQYFIIKGLVFEQQLFSEIDYVTY